MKITFLGTGTSQGVPVIACNCKVCKSNDARDNRLRSSIMIEDNGVVVVIYSGPDFRQQMLRLHVKRMDALLFTHAHKDHTAGMDDIRAFNYFMQEPSNVYATLQVQEVIRKEFSYIFSGVDYPGLPQLVFHTIKKNEPFSVAHLKFIPIEVMHHRLPVLGFRVNDFTYITDANFIDDAEMKKIEGSKVIVLNALRREPHISHFTLEEATALAKKMNSPKTYFTHLSHQMGLHCELCNELPNNIQPAFDGLQIEL
jgi:phosphoribosyl 1,2-cyclic phosphate phosphodiesterase